MIEFDYDKIMRPKTVINCKTKEQAYNLRIWAHSKGLQWKSGASYNNTCFASYNRHKNFCHNFYDGYHGSLNYYGNEGYTILTYNDVILKQGDKMNNKEFIKIGNKEFEITNRHSGCLCCHFYKYWPNSSDKCQMKDMIEDLFGINCFKMGVVLVEKPQWVQCTYENTKVGDTVKDKQTGDLMTIKCFIDREKESSADQFIYVFEHNFQPALSNFEKQI